MSGRTRVVATGMGGVGALGASWQGVREAVAANPAQIFENRGRVIPTRSACASGSQAIGTSETEVVGHLAHTLGARPDGRGAWSRRR